MEARLYITGDAAYTDLLERTLYCCPPNIVRTIAEVSNYFYSLSDSGLWFNLYGGSTLETRLEDGSSLAG